MSLYATYHLVIDSELTLPELRQISRCDKTSVDVTVRLGVVNIAGIDWVDTLAGSLLVSPQHLFLDIEGVARFLVSGGRHIQVEMYAGANLESVRLYLLGSVFGAILFQRGHLVLHGNAIRVGDQCLICVGDSGAGKSTLAAGFLKRGFSVLADDVVPLTPDYKALPGFPRIKLWQDAAQHLGIDTRGLLRIRPDIEKFNWPISRDMANNEALTVRWVFCLQPNNVNELQIEPVSGIDRFRVLLQNTYRSFYLKGMRLEGQHLQQCGELSKHIHLARLTRPVEGFDLDGLIDALLADMNAHV